MKICDLEGLAQADRAEQEQKIQQNFMRPDKLQI